MSRSFTVLEADVEGEILVCDEGLSLWGGVDANTGVIQDAQHPQCGESLAGRIVMMPCSRGSCSGGSILLGLALAGRGPVAVVFQQTEDILTLGATIAACVFDHPIAVIQLSADDYNALARKKHATIRSDHIAADSLSLELSAPNRPKLVLTDSDQAMRDGVEGKAVKQAMEVIIAAATAQGASELVDVSRVHIDGCIYADPVFLTFAQRMSKLGATVRVPTTLNAISVEYANWREQGVDESFGRAAAELAALYVDMGANASFTCAPYLLDDRPAKGEVIGWAESNAVIYANSVLGAQTTKHPDFIDLCIALTGRAPKTGVYCLENRKPQNVVHVTKPDNADDAFWPMLGWLLGEASPGQIPLLVGLEKSAPSSDDLKALCAAFGTTSAAPMLHVAGVTPESTLSASSSGIDHHIESHDFQRLWRQFNDGNETIDLVALGSPHFSASESRAFLKLLNGREVGANVSVIITLGRAVLDELRSDGTADALAAAGVTLVTDVCWCSITEPVFPTNAKTLMTNSGKYAHYGPGLSGRRIRFGSLADCANSAVSGHAEESLPDWI